MERQTNRRSSVSRWFVENRPVRATVQLQLLSRLLGPLLPSIPPKSHVTAAHLSRLIYHPLLLQHKQLFLQTLKFRLLVLLERSNGLVLQPSVSMDRFRSTFS